MYYVSQKMQKNIIYLFCPEGIGCDAKVAYDFHTTREEKPDQFCSQVGEYNETGTLKKISPWNLDTDPLEDY